MVSLGLGVGTTYARYQHFSSVNDEIHLFIPTFLTINSLGYQLPTD